ncbi:hypothetical protein [Streptomyces sp. V4I2]|uniref:hypothetical protein n=1 Tax=Streptomyces sp. V4I2 TaxID=3042280 RepID=UPI00278348EB|nr:hypothetical protein [Streptomyces sp. V4I2]MDQ1047510.1 hypothetical protein [Streptomyces sp. V4I2]
MYGPDVELHLVRHLGVLKMHGLHTSYAPGIFNWIVSDYAPPGAPRRVAELHDVPPQFFSDR